MHSRISFGLYTFHPSRVALQRAARNADTMLITALTGVAIMAGGLGLSAGWFGSLPAQPQGGPAFQATAGKAAEAPTLMASALSLRDR